MQELTEPSISGCASGCTLCRLNKRNQKNRVLSQVYYFGSSVAFAICAAYRLILVDTMKKMEDAEEEV